MSFFWGKELILNNGVMMRTVVTIMILYSIDESVIISWLNVLLGDQS